jgi:hypothetical protein
MHQGGEGEHGRYGSGCALRRRLGGWSLRWRVPSADRGWCRERGARVNEREGQEPVYRRLRRLVMLKMPMRRMSLRSRAMSLGVANQLELFLGNGGNDDVQVRPGLAPEPGER